MKAYIVIWVLSVWSSVAIGAAWLHFHPAPRMVRVDVGSLFDEQKKLLAGRIKPGMSDEERRVLLQSAAEFAGRVESALAVLSSECRCAVVNSAAILQVPAGSSGIEEATGRLRDLLGAAGPNSTIGVAAEK